MPLQFLYCGDVSAISQTTRPNQLEHSERGYGYSYGDPELYVPGEIPGTVERVVGVNPPWAAPYSPASDNHQPEHNPEPCPTVAGAPVEPEVVGAGAPVQAGISCNPCALVSRCLGYLRPDCDSLFNSL